MMNACPPPIYLDHNATTPVFPEVVEAMRLLDRTLPKSRQPALIRPRGGACWKIVAIASASCSVQRAQDRIDLHKRRHGVEQSRHTRASGARL